MESMRLTVMTDKMTGLVQLSKTFSQWELVPSYNLNVLSSMLTSVPQPLTINVQHKRNRNERNAQKR